VKPGAVVGLTVSDLHGSVAAELGAGGSSILSALRYDPYGLVAPDGTWDSGGSFANPWRYQGRLDVSPDAANALYDYGARYYAPASGVFTQLDSYAGQALDPRSMNRYLYAEANPATLIDPDGHAALAACEPECGTSSEAANNQLAANRAAARQPDPVVVAHGAAPYDNDLFTGYNPWDLAHDPTLLAIKDSLYANCTTPWDPGCEPINELADWEARNRELYCSFHRAECDNGLARELHDTLGGLGLVPLIGIVFDGADTLLYIAEGDGGGSLIALGSMVPLVGDAGRAGTFVLRHADEAADLGGIRGVDFVVAEGGTAVPIPRGFEGTLARDKAGLVFQKPGSLGEADMLRIADANDLNPTGYVRYYNSSGQPLDAFGRTGTAAATHLSLTGGRYPGFYRWLGKY
jgi:RHS repeat-associated protein